MPSRQTKLYRDKNRCTSETPFMTQLERCPSDHDKVMDVALKVRLNKTLEKLKLRREQ